MNKISLNEQAQEILRIAEQHGVEQNFFFLTTFKRYQVQIGILNDLEKTICAEGRLVTKEYVKGRKNVYSHPAISDYNRTTDSANKTVVTLMKIITTLRDRQEDEPDPLLEILGGRAALAGNSRTEIASRNGTNPTYSVYYKYARHYRINNLVYITFHLKAKITNAGSGYAAIKGLPFTVVDGADGQGFTVRESLVAISSYPASAHLSDSTATINVQSSGGDMALQWKTGDLWIGFSGYYIKS